MEKDAFKEVMEIEENLEDNDELKEAIRGTFKNNPGLCELGFIATEQVKENNKNDWGLHITVRGCKSEKKSVVPFQYLR